MKKQKVLAVVKRVIWPVLYILVFLLTLRITVYWVNFGSGGGTTLVNHTSFPELTIVIDGHPVNVMTPYTVVMDAGMLRDCVTPVGTDRQILVELDENGHDISQLQFVLRDASNTLTIEEGALLKNIQEGTNSYKLTLKQALEAGQEYCLNIGLTDVYGDSWYYYTRVVDGEDLDAAAKLQFVRDFSAMTFDPEKSSQIGVYLETSAANDNLSYTNIDIYSTTSSVMWGKLTPEIVSEVRPWIKAIDETSATIRLFYRVQKAEGKAVSEYIVSEYYTIVLIEDQYHLKDFRRSLSQVPMNNSFEAVSGRLKLGIVDEDSLQLLFDETEETDRVVFVMDGRLWYYQSNENLMTCVYGSSKEETLNTWLGNYSFGIKTLRMDPDGKLYFLVYGAMGRGFHDGENGIALYRFDPAVSNTEELAYIPSDRGWEILGEDLKRLAYMNKEHLLYLCLDDEIYRVDYAQGLIRSLTEGVSSKYFKISEDQSLLAVWDLPEGSEPGKIRVRYLDQDVERTLKDTQGTIKLLGFFGSDLIYGESDDGLFYTDGAGNRILPMNRIRILDRNLDEIRTYKSGYKYIMDARLEGSTIRLDLAYRSGSGDEMIYTPTNGDFLVNSSQEGGKDSHLVTVYDQIRRNELYLSLSSALKVDPVAASAKVLQVPEETYTVASGQMQHEKFYLYTGEGLVGMYEALTDAIEACDQPTGLIVSFDKKIVWTKNGVSPYIRLPIGSIRQGDIRDGVVTLICTWAEDHEPYMLNAGWTLMEALRANLGSHKALDLQGTKLSDALYILGTGRPVIAMLRPGEYVVIVGYSGDYLQIADPTTGEVMDWNYQTYSRIFEEQGNVFISYY